MNGELLNCWEIKKCERQTGGKKVSELGECKVSMEAMGHSCWAVAGTLCGGEIQGTHAQKIGFCTSCEVYQTYNRATGDLGEKISTCYPEEDARYYKIMMRLYNDKAFSESVHDSL